MRDRLPTPPEIRLRGPLQDDAKKQRRNLLAASVLSIIIVDVGLVPQQISALGIVFSEADKTTILMILLAANFYFFFSFLLYGLADFSAWKAEIRWSQRELADKVIQRSGEQQRRLDLDYYDVAWGKRREPIRIILLSDVKAIFDLLGPLPLVLYGSMRLLGISFSWAVMGFPGTLFLAVVFGYLATRFKRLKRRSDRSETRHLHTGGRQEIERDS